MNPDHKIKFKNALSACAVPAGYSVLFVLLMILWKVFHGPSPDEVYARIVHFFQLYGFPIIAISAFIEGIVLVNFYFPGSAVILVGVATTKGNPTRAFLLVAVVSLAFFLAAQLDYGLGRFGFRKIVLRFGGKAWLHRAEKWYAQYGAKAIPFTFIHPNLGAFMAVSCGNTRFNYGHFVALSLFSTMLWNSFWGTVAYNFPQQVANVATQPLLLLGGFLAWTAFAFVRGWFAKTSNQSDTACRSEA